MRRAFITVAITGIVLVLSASYVVGDRLSSPALRSIGLPPPDLQAQTVRIPTNSSECLVGWFWRGNPGFGGVLLLHGVGADRRQMLDRAIFLHKEGYSVLLIDLPAHGESSGERITFGAHEGEAVRVALSFLRNQLGPQEKIAVIGVSLGAASLVLAKPEQPLDAIVLESMYSTITDAVANRLELAVGRVARVFTPLLTWQLPMRLGIWPSELEPLTAVASLHTPVMIASGDRDLHTTITETKSLFDSAKDPKELWIVEGAAHVDLYAFSPEIYRSRISGFLAKHLHGLN
ncbi:MAG: alpha/beta hydrolase [Candidatus Competibacteraceae bacterium]|nr:alpha/beta hydrolase [Candidatus Competibacteraceae bacterium]